MSIDKNRLKKNMIKIGLDALGIGLCGGVAYLATAFVPAIKGFEVFLGVAAGLWLYAPVRNLITRIKE